MQVLQGNFPQAKSGGLGNSLGILGTLTSFIPGLQPVGAGLGALGSALNGNYLGAALGLSGVKSPVKSGASTSGINTSIVPQTQQLYTDNKWRLGQ